MNKNTNQVNCCTKCNNRLTIHDVSIIAELMTSHVPCGGKLTKDERIAFRRLMALNVRRNK